MEPEHFFFLIFLFLMHQFALEFHILVFRQEYEILLQVEFLSLVDPAVDLFSDQ